MEEMTLREPLAFLTEGKLSGVTDPRILAAILALVMICLYIIFR